MPGRQKPDPRRTREKENRADATVVGELRDTKLKGGLKAHLRRQGAPEHDRMGGLPSQTVNSHKAKVVCELFLAFCGEEMKSRT